MQLLKAALLTVLHSPTTTVKSQLRYSICPFDHDLNPQPSDLLGRMLTQLNAKGNVLDQRVCNA